MNTQRDTVISKYPVGEVITEHSADNTQIKTVRGYRGITENYRVQTNTTDTNKGKNSSLTQENTKGAELLRIIRI